MPLSDIRMRFVSEYRGDIKDPVLTTLLQAIDSYQSDVQNELLLSVYAQRSDQISDGLFEVLRRHLFGQMFPGPVYAVAQASLRDADTTAAVMLEQHHYLSLQDSEGNRVLFAPQEPVWIVPSFTNDVQVQTVGDDLMLGLSVPVQNLRDSPGGRARIHASGVDPFLLERLRCRLPQSGDGQEDPAPTRSVLRPQYPGVFTVADEFFHTPYAATFIDLSFPLLENAAVRDGVAWLPFPGLGGFGAELDRRLTLNSFVVWNMVHGEMLAIQSEGNRYRVPVSGPGTQETILVMVEDLGSDPAIEYANAASVADPRYPYQYSASVDPSREDIYLTLSPPPGGEVKVQYYQYETGEYCANIAEGRSFGLYRGVDERVKTVQLLNATHRLEVLSDKQRIWETFRSMLVSRNRWLTRDDLRAAVSAFPAFAGRRNVVVREKIGFRELVGRAPKGYLTPYTEVLVPVREKSLLQDPERAHFQRRLESYITRRSVNGSFVRVVFISADEV
jgi:hypothetical protein